MKQLLLLLLPALALAQTTGYQPIYGTDTAGDSRVKIVGMFQDLYTNKANTVHAHSASEAWLQTVLATKMDATKAFSLTDVTAWIGYTPMNQAWRGAVNGVASLDAGGLVPLAQLPPTAIGVPYTGATQNLNLGSHVLFADHFTSSADVPTRLWLRRGTPPNNTVDPDGGVADGVLYVDEADNITKILLRDNSVQAIGAVVNGSPGTDPPIPGGTVTPAGCVYQATPPVASHLFWNTSENTLYGCGADSMFHPMAAKQFTIPFSVAYKTAVCQDQTPGLAFSTTDVAPTPVCIVGANTRQGAAQFDTPGQALQDHLSLPPDYAAASGVEWGVSFTSPSDTSGVVAWTLSWGCVGDGASTDPALPNSNVIATSPALVAGAIKAYAATTFALTNCAAGNELYFKVGLTSLPSTGVQNLLGFWLRIRRTIQ
jgi:hypothetical protein